MVEQTVEHAAQESKELLGPDIRRDFAVVIPAFDEAANIPDLIREIRAVFDQEQLDGEVILVDDGSADGTADLAKSEAAGWSNLRVLRHRINQGKTEAILTAALATQKTYLIVFDADLQHLPTEFPRFLGKLGEGWDIVTGRKVGAYDKRGVSSVYNWLSRRIFDVPVSDLNSIKAFRREILDGVRLRHDWHRFFVVMAYAKGYSATEIDVTLHPRRAGTSKYSGPGRVIGGLLDLISVWFQIIFARKPMLLFGVPGVVLIALGLGVGAVAFYLRIVEGFGFRPLLYLVILLVTVGTLCFVAGLLAEMIAGLRDELDFLRRKISERD